MHATPMDILSSTGLVPTTPESNIIMVYIKPTKLIYLGVVTHNFIIWHANIYPTPVGTIQEWYLLQISQPRHFQEPLGIIIWAWFTFPSPIKYSSRYEFSPFLFMITYNMFTIMNVMVQPSSNRQPNQLVCVYKVSWSKVFKIHQKL